MNVFQDGSRLYDDGTFVERTDACLGVRFFLLPVLDELATADAGMPKYKDIEMVEIIIPGSKDITHVKVSDAYKARFKEKYAQFKSSETEMVEGTPLSQFPFISPGERKELEYLNIYTGEQLVKMPDGNIDRISGDGRKLIKKVKAYMDMAHDTSVVSRMTEENENLKREMELIKEQMAKILTLKEDEKNGSHGNNEGLTNAKDGVRGRGRPKVRSAYLDESTETFNA